MVVYKKYRKENEAEEGGSSWGDEGESSREKEEEPKQQKQTQLEGHYCTYRLSKEGEFLLFNNNRPN